MSDSSIAIYEPPARGWPYLVVVRRADEYEMTTAKTRKEAREIALSKRLAKS